MKIEGTYLINTYVYVRVKICCINSIEEAHCAIQYGASALGLVSKMPSGPGVISESQIAEIAETIPPAVSTFLLTSETKVTNIINQQKRCKTNTIQLVDQLSEGTHKELKAELPGISIVQVIHVNDERSINEAINISKTVDGILLDSGDPHLSIKELGGTGRTHDWKISQKIVSKVYPCPVFLAGGLTPDNVKEAIKIVKPFGVDVCNGVRTNGGLDEQKLLQFFKNLRY